MKKYLIQFLQRGLTVSVLGPIVAAIVYAILGACGVIETMTVYAICLGILSSALMAFIAGGITVIYEIEQLPLFSATLIHGVTLYLDYILVYLINGWLEAQLESIGVFTGCFIVGYALIWAIIYFTTKNSTTALNRKLKAE